MIPEFEPGGNLPPGLHWATWRELHDRFGTTRWRRRLLVGLRVALENLQSAGCLTAYVDGSFVSSKSEPGDFDACWEEAGVDLDRLDPVLLTIRCRPRGAEGQVRWRVLSGIRGSRFGRRCLLELLSDR